MRTPRNGQLCYAGGLETLGAFSAPVHRGMIVGGNMLWLAQVSSGIDSGGGVSC